MGAFQGLLQITITNYNLSYEIYTLKYDTILDASEGNARRKVKN